MLYCGYDVFLSTFETGHVGTFFQFPTFEYVGNSGMCDCELGAPKIDNTSLWSARAQPVERRFLAWYSPLRDKVVRQLERPQDDSGLHTSDSD